MSEQTGHTPTDGAQPYLRTLLDQLKIPADYARSEYIAENTIPELEIWKQKTISVLQDIQQIVKIKEGSDLSLEARADLVFALVPFASECSLCSGDDKKQEEDAIHGQDDWVLVEAQHIAQDLLSLPEFSPPSRGLVTHVLTHNLKPIFKSNPHPRLHAETGRKLARAAGGPMAMQDYYDGQTWKQYLGVGKVVLWCVRYAEEEAYENTWHLVIPPVMTLLDDYEARFKLQGVLVVQEMLRHVPRDLLKRTGVSGLLRQSLRTCLSHLQSPETPELLKHAISASISLTLLTTSVAPGSKPSSDRFDELSSLLGEGIISGIWLYAEEKPGVVNATFDALPPLLRALDIGSVRFLKALIPQLAHTLIPRPLVEPERKLQLSALRVIETLVEVCSPRINSWKETILDAIGRCWVDLIDRERSDGNASFDELQMKAKVKKQLQAICVKLAEVCPSVVQEEFPRLLEADKDLFKDLFLGMPA
ncbi:hypothetical protein BDZ97DRAFT_1919843 [Flammula alnicola]|nr:hypothetical protein BDZ97DRAFT_1919843 [Flammula alnicola]